jgi:hypothetical protein
VHLDPSGKSANDTKYMNIMQTFFSDLSGSTYLNIVSQYPGKCRPPNIPLAQSCYGAGSVVVNKAVTVTTAYPHAGTAAAPLQDVADIQQTLITTFINNNNIALGLNTEFFVFTGDSVVTCQSAGTPFCTGGKFCDYHSSFTLNGNTVLYGLISNGVSGCGCPVASLNTTSPNGLSSADCSIIGVSHEFFESITDPTWAAGNFAWEDGFQKKGGFNGNEIGDQCNGLTGTLNTDGSNITLNGHNYVVQQMWSNDDAGCVLSFGQPAILGPSIEYDLNTGLNILSANSSAAASLNISGSTLQTNTLKSTSQPSWSNNSTHVRIFSVSAPGGDNVGIKLTPNPPGSNWDINDLEVVIRSPNGETVCDVSLIGFPLATLSSPMPNATFNIPDCAPLEHRTVTVCGTIEVDNTGRARGKQAFSMQFPLTKTSPTNSVFWKNQTSGGCEVFANPWTDVSASLQADLSLNSDGSVSVGMSTDLGGFDKGPLCISAAGSQTISSAQTPLNLSPGQAKPFDLHLQNSNNDIWADYHFNLFNDCEGCGNLVTCPR